MLPLLFLPAHAFQDTIGGDDTVLDYSGMLKLVRIEVNDFAAVTHVEFAALDPTEDTGISIVAYVRAGDSWELVDAVDATLPGAGESWATADVTWLLLPGETYAIGAYVGDGWSYAYDEGRTRDPWFGSVTGSYQAPADAAPATFQADREDYYYYMVLTSSDADADADGVPAATYGGADCDDTDPSVTEPTDEVAYDGVDQDCDGADLTDVDGDGADAVEAGGDDCDDTAAGIGPAQAEICEDGIDNDCVGGDADCAVDVGDTGIPGGDGKHAGELTAAGECRCGTGDGTSALAAVLLAAVAGARRRSEPFAGGSGPR